MSKFRWKRYGGYEVSSRGDRRFSAFNAVLDGNSIEQLYQCDIKGYASIHEGKGKPPLKPMSREALYRAYRALWKMWALENLPLMRELFSHARKADWTLSDRFASTEINQARALADILNELSSF